MLNWLKRKIQKKAEKLSNRLKLELKLAELRCKWYEYDNDIYAVIDNQMDGYITKEQCEEKILELQKLMKINELEAIEIRRQLSNAEKRSTT